LPFTPSPEDSTKEDSSDEFEAVDHPRSQLPSAFFHTPNKPPFISSSLSLLTELSNQSSASPQVPIERAHITTPTERDAPEIKQESFETPHAPNSIPGGKILSNLPFAYVPPTSIKPIVPAPTIAQHITMSTTPYEMPFCGTDHAPKFDGTPDMLGKFIDAYEECADRAGLQGLNTIKGIIKYLERNDWELWAGLPEAQASNYNAFMKEIKVMYLGWDGKRQYAPADLQALVHEYAQKPMFSGQELSAYLRAFRKIMQPLLNEDRIGKVERDCLFMEGIPSEAQVPIQMRLMIKHSDHYPQDPYPYTQVYDAGQFVLPANTPPPTSAPNVQDVIPMLSPPVPSTHEQMPMPRTVIKREYRCEASSFNDCAFCGSIEHFFTCCLEGQRYIDAGKCKVHEEMCKLVLLNGDFIPGCGLMKDKLDWYYANRAMQEVKASKGVTAGLFYHANSEIDAIVEVGSSAFVHTIAHPDVEESDDDETVNLMQEALAYVTAKHNQKRGAKGKTVRFDGIEMPPSTHPRPQPASKQATVEDEIISPEVQASSSKGKGLEVAKIVPLNVPVTDDSMERTTLVPKSAAPASPQSAPTSTNNSTSLLPVPPLSAPTAQSTTYHHAFALEDKEADKRVVERLLDSNLNIPVWELLAVSPDVRQHFRKLMMKKRITVGAVSVHKLSGQPAMDTWLKQYEGVHLWSDDGRIVTDHFMPLRCIRATTIGGRTLTCILDQGAKVVVMPREVWKELGVPLRSDHSLNMESVNMTCNSTLGMIENVLLDFGAGPMYFQVQVTAHTNFDVLLGRPFFKLTSCQMFDLPNGEQDILLTDPNMHKELRIPTLPWVKCTPPKESKRANSTQVDISKEEDF
jgi:hypothetical protein